MQGSRGLPDFDAPDAEGRRTRSLDLYGVTARYRRDDGFDLEHREIVRLAASLTGTTSASLDLWAPDALITLAATPDEPGLGAAVRTAMAGHCPLEPVLVEGGDDLPAVWAAAPLTGREGVPLGLLAVGFVVTSQVPRETTVLLKHLAGAAVGVLDRQRRAWERRGRPGAAPLWAVDGRDRRRERRTD